jgi:hypothetical protein
MHRFQSFWFGSDLPAYQRLAAQSFIDFGFRYTLYSYQKFDVPNGVDLRDAREILPEDRVFFCGAHGSVSAFSDLFRYHLLHEVGGWWIDADVVCLSEKVPEADIFLGWESEEWIASAILKVPKHHRFARDLRDAAERAGTNIAWGQIGPHLVTRLAKEHGLLDLVSPQATSFPVQWMDALHLLIPQRRDQIRQQVKNAPFLHIWNEMLRRAVVFTWMAPPPGSFIAELFDRHGVGFHGAHVYSADQIQRLSDNFWNAYGREESALVSLRSQLSEARAEIVRLSHELQSAQAVIGELKSSSSWRVTASARYVSTLLRGGLR